MEDRVVLLFVSTRKRDNEETRGMWESAFRRSRWFTRGWTLQELLAPVSVQFFEREGERLGDKRTLEQIIHEITTIPWDTLRGYPLHQFQAPPGTPRHQSDTRPVAEQAGADIRAPGTLPPDYYQIQGFETRTVGSKSGYTQSWSPGAISDRTTKDRG